MVECIQADVYGDVDALVSESRTSQLAFHRNFNTVLERMRWTSDESGTSLSMYSFRLPDLSQLL